MNTENEKWTGDSEENTGAGREGYRNYSREGYNRRDDNRPSYNRENRFNREGGDRPQRSVYNNDRYNSDRPQRSYNREGGDRPYNREGNDRPYRNSYNNENGERRTSYNREGGNDRPYRSSYNSNRPSYGDRPQRSYNREDKPWRNNAGEGGDRPSSFRRPIPNSQAGNSEYKREEGERPRRPRINETDRSQGYSRQPGGYRQQGGYSRQQSGYSRPQQGGYRPQRRTADYDPNAKYSKKKQIEYKEQFIDPNEPIRLNKFLANAGICSRREADEFITAGVVSVNGEVVTELGTKVKRSDEVKFHDQPVSIERKIYVLLNKPKDCVTTSDDPQARLTVMDLVKGACTERIYPVGRLDRNTTGVLLLTNDGDLASKLTHPKFLKKKIYHVHTDKNVTRADLDQIASGIQLEDGEIHADAISYADEDKKDEVGIEIHSGKNRIVRRIFESLGYKVTKLDRVYFAGLTKKGLRRGDWRYLTEPEVNYLRMGSFE